MDTISLLQHFRVITHASLDKSAVLSVLTLDPFFNTIAIVAPVRVVIDREPAYRAAASDLVPTDGAQWSGVHRLLASCLFNKVFAGHSALRCFSTSNYKDCK